MVDQSLGCFGDIKVLVNNARVHDGAPFREEPKEMWQRMCRVNVLGRVLPPQAVVRKMKGSRGGVMLGRQAKTVGDAGIRVVGARFQTLRSLDAILATVPPLTSSTSKPRSATF